MVEPPKKTLKLKHPLPSGKGKKRGRGKRPTRKPLPERPIDASARLAAFTVLHDILHKAMVTDAALAQNTMFPTL